MNVPHRLLTTSLAIAFSPFFAVSSVKAETWTGGGEDSSYFNPLNWDSSGIPGSSSALIFQGSNYSVLFNGETGYAAEVDFLDETVTSFNMGDGGLFQLGTGAINASASSIVSFQSGEVRAGSLNVSSGAEVVVSSVMTLAPHEDENSDMTAVSLHSSTLSILSGGNLTVRGNGASQQAIFKADGNSDLLIGSNGELHLEDTVAVLGDSSDSVVNFAHGQGVVRVANSSQLYLAGSGTGTYRLETGGVLEIGGDSLRGARDTDGQYAFQLHGGKIKVTGADLNTTIDSVITNGRTVIDTNGYDATWGGNIETSATATGGREFAKEGTGKLTFSGASRAMYAFATLGGETVQTTGSTQSTAFLVGYGAGNTASFDLEGGSITISGDGVGSFRIGDYGGTGVFNQRGGTVTMEAGTSFNLGNLSQVKDTVRYNGHGTYNLYDGTFTLNAGLHNIGRSNGNNNSSTGEMNILGGELIVQGGGSFIIGSRDSTGGSPLGTGIVTQTGGVADFTDGKLFIAGYGDGEYHLNGGILRVSGTSLNARYNNTTASYLFALGGGTIEAGEGLTTSINSVITKGRSVINTNGMNVVWGGNIETSATATGGRELAKEGTGKLTFSGASRAMHAFATLGGETVQTTGSTQSTAFLVGYGAGNTASYDLEGGSITISGESGSFRIGDYGGTGVFNQRGGTVTLEAGSSFNLGNLSQVKDTVRYNGHGTYNLYAGTFTLNAGLHNIGRSDGSNNTSSGEMNILGGELIVKGGGRFIIGSRDSTGGSPLGTGIVTQTGGVADFTDGKLFIAGYGDGEYHLNGGILRVGSDLSARYNNTTASYLFSLGGGKIEIAADLTTNANATLVADTQSTIDTGEHAAIFSGSITGSGNLLKRGTGQLTVNQTLQATEIDVTDGTLQAGTLNASIVRVNQASLRTNSLSATDLQMTEANIGSVSGNFVLGSASKMEGTGVIATSATLQGTVRAGSDTAAGVITANENLVLANGSSFLWTIFDNSNGNGDNNRIEVEGALTIQTGVTFSLSFGESVDFTHEYWTESGMSWLLIVGTQVNSFSLSDISLVSNGMEFSEYGSFRLAQTSEGIAVEWEAVPEPSTYLFVLVAGAGLAFSRRRR